MALNSLSICSRVLRCGRYSRQLRGTASACGLEPRFNNSCTAVYEVGRGVAPINIIFSCIDLLVLVFDDVNGG